MATEDNGTGGGGGGKDHAVINVPARRSKDAGAGGGGFYRDGRSC